MQHAELYYVKVAVGYKLASYYKCLYDVYIVKM